MYRLIIEELLGVHVEANHLRLSPCVPSTWSEYTVHYRHKDARYHIRVSIEGAGSGSMRPSA